jgi:hypothetical protein
MAEAHRIRAEASDYKSLLDALRARAQQLGITRIEIDDIGGLTNGYASKLLSPAPMKYVGRASLGPLLGALGIKLIIVEDEDQMRRIEKRIAHRRATAGRCGSPRTPAAAAAISVP